MTRRVVISGVGPISGLGVGIEANWQAVRDGNSAMARIETFNPDGFDCRIAAEVKSYKARDYVPKSYRKALKVMARDIELTVGAASKAAEDAGLKTKGSVDNGDAVTYQPQRVGAQIGAGLIAAELNELTGAMAEATDENGGFDIHKWGESGMQNLTPLWLLKYLPNMLACHVTIVHDTQGPSNTITCGEASSELSIGEAMRVIQRGSADMCFCGGIESKINPMNFLRQSFTGRLTEAGNDDPASAVRPFDAGATGTALGEGGGIVILEALETFGERDGKQPLAELVGFGTSQTVNLKERNLYPDAEGVGIALAIEKAIAEAGIEAAQIGLIVPFGIGDAKWDAAEAAALKRVFGDQLGEIPVTSMKAMVGTCGAGSGGFDVCIAAKAVAEQTVPATINCEKPVGGLQAGNSEARQADIEYALTYSTSIGGQNAALVLKKI